MGSKENKIFKCLFCEKTFPKKYNWQRHAQKVHQIEVQTKIKVKPHKCVVCGQAFSKKNVLYRHCRKLHVSMLDHLDIPMKRPRNLEMQISRKKKLSITPEDVQTVEEHLPKEYDYKVLNFSQIAEDKFEFRVKFYVDDVDEVPCFLEGYTVKNCIRYRLGKTGPATDDKLFDKHYCCHHNPQKRTEKNRKNTGCRATASLIVRALKDEEKLTCFFRVTHNHNHDLDETEAKLLYPSSEVTEKFTDMLLSGIQPYKALLMYRKELELEYGEEYPKICENRSICPTKGWVYSLYYKIFKKGEPKSEEPEVTIFKGNDDIEMAIVEEMEPLDVDENFDADETGNPNDQYLTVYNVDNPEIEFLEDEFETEEELKEFLRLNRKPDENDLKTLKEKQVISMNFEKNLFSLTNRVIKNFDYFKDGVLAFCDNFQKLNSDAALLSALNSFGQNR